MAERYNVKNSGNDYPEKRWLRILILWTLFDKQLYGYLILDRIEKYSRGTQIIKVGSLYTILRRMEKEKLLTSSWEKGQGGPDKRVYGITKLGHVFFKKHLEMICRRKTMIDQIVKFYKNNFC